MNVTYIAHSGFKVETESHHLIFDYHRGTLDLPNDGKTAIFFVSHFHEDHYNPEIYAHRTRSNTHYVVSKEIKNAPSDADATRVSPNNEYDIGGTHIMTLRSTDCGVAYLVTVDGETIYHAGDLHLWVWDGAPYSAELKMTRLFEGEIAKLKGIHIDAAFLPLDSRQGTGGMRGFDYTMRTLDIEKAFPMHFWGRPDYVAAFVSSSYADDYRDRIVALTKEGASVSI